MSDPVSLLAREVLRERMAVLVAESCAWSVGLSDRPHLARRHGRHAPTGLTLGARAEGGLPLADDDGRLELVDAVPGSFQDALGALAPDGGQWADRLEQEVLAPFVLESCVMAAERYRRERPAAWAELADETGEDPDDVADVVRVAEWEAPLRTDAEQLMLAALGAVPLVEVEAEGLPLSLVRSVEAELRRAAEPAEVAPAPTTQDLAGALFLAEAALSAVGLALPVPPAEAGALLALLGDEGIEPTEVLELLPHLPVAAATAEEVARRVDDLR